MKRNPPALHLPLFALLHRALCVFVLWALLVPFPLWANPNGPSVEAGGTAPVFSFGGKLVIPSVQDGTVIDWESFDIDAGEVTEFRFLDIHGRVLNRDLSGDFSNIAGELLGREQLGEGGGTSPVGQIFLVNPNGIVIDGLIDAGAFFGVAGDLNNLDSLIADPANWTVLDADLTGAVTVTENGAINAALMPSHGSGELFHPAISGNVVLLGRQIQNLGTIAAPGTVALVAGGQAVLANLESNITIEVLSGGDPAATGVDHQGDIDAGGSIQLAASDMYALGVNTSGILQANGDVKVSATALVEGAPVSSSNSGIQLSSPEAEPEPPVLVSRGHLEPGVVEPITGENVVIIGDVTLTGRTDIEADQSVTIAGSVDGPHDLQVFAGDGYDYAGSIEIEGDVGSVAPLDSVLLEVPDAFNGGPGTITTENITTTDEHIQITAQNGEIVTGDLTTDSGDVIVEGGSVTIGNIDTEGGPEGEGEFGFVQVDGDTVVVGDIDTVDLDADGGPTGASVDIDAGDTLMTGSITTATGDIEAEAGDDATVTGDITTTTGNVMVTAGAGEGGGDVVVMGKIDTAGDGPTIGAVTLSGDNVDVGDVDTVGFVPGGEDTSSGLTIDAPGDVTTGVITAGVGDVVVDAGNDATVGGVSTTTGNIDVDAGNNAAVSGVIASTTGDVHVQAGNDAAVDGVTTTVGNVEVIADNNATVSGPITTTTGNLTVTANADSEGGGDALVTGNIDTAGNGPGIGSVAVTGVNVTVADVDTVDTGTGTSSGLTLSGVDVATGVLTTAGSDIDIDADNDATVGGASTTTGNVDVAAGNDASVGGITTAGGNVTVTADSDGSGGGDASVSGNIGSGGGNVAVSGAAAAVSGITTAGGDLSLAATQGDLELSGDLGAGGGDVLLVAANEVVLPGSVVVRGGDVDLDGRVQGQGGASFRVKGKQITLRNDVTTGGDQTYIGDRAIRLGADSGSYKSRKGSVTFDGPTVLEGDTDVTSADSTNFSGTIDGPHDLTVDAGGELNVGGDIGAGDRPRNLVLDGRDGVNISGDVVVRGNLDLLSERGGIVFDASGRNPDTTVDAGGSITAGSDLSSVPDRATIYAAAGSDSLTFEAGDDFTMGRNQKLSANELTVLAGDTARVGDLSAVESILVGADTVSFRQRQPGLVLQPDGSLVQEVGARLPDVVANEVTIDGRVTNPDQVTFSTASGSVGGGTSFPLVFPLRDELTSSDLLSGDTVLDLAALDLKALGIAVAGGRIDPTLQDQTPGLDFIGLVPLALVPVAEIGGLRASEVLSFLRCGLLEGGEDEDLPEYCLLPHVGEGPAGEQDEEAPVAEAIMDSEPMLVATTIYRKLTESGSGDELRGDFGPAFSEFETKSGGPPVDGREFSRYLGTTADHARATDYIDQAGFLFDQLEKLDMEEAEYQELRVEVLRDMSVHLAVSGLSPDVLGATIEASR